jgi:hypothetical protein
VSPPPLPPAPPPQEIITVEKRVEVPVEVKKYVEVEVPVEVTKVVEVEKVVRKKVTRTVEVPVEVEKRVEVPVPYERIVHVEVPIERIVWRDVPVPVQSGEERVITKEIQVPVEVVREVPVPVEHIVYKEIQVPIEVGTRQETRVGDTRTIVNTEVRRGTHMTPDHQRANMDEYTESRIQQIETRASLSPKTTYIQRDAGSPKRVQRSVPVPVRSVCCNVLVSCRLLRLKQSADCVWEF